MNGGKIDRSGRRLPDALWARMAPRLPRRPKHPLGGHNPRVPDRAAMDAIFFVLRTGGQGKALNVAGICSSSSAHRRLVAWSVAGVFHELWRQGLLAEPSGAPLPSRRVLIRWEKRPETYLARLHFALALITWRRPTLQG